jgi:hypothetical protein
MKFIKKYDDFEKLTETSEFMFQSLSTGTGAMQPRDPQLSFDPFDRYAGLKRQQIDTLVQISTGLRNLHGGSYVDSSNVDMKQVFILKMFDNNLNLLDIYLKFIIGEQIFLGIFQNWGGFQTPFFKSSSFDEVYGNASVKIKVIGILKNILHDYFKPHTGRWIVNAGINVKNSWGQNIFVKPGSKIVVDEVITQDEKPKINIIYEESPYHIQDVDFYWFKWNCEQEPAMVISNI